jgi:hypothetical protein
MKKEKNMSFEELDLDETIDESDGIIITAKEPAKEESLEAKKKRLQQELERCEKLENSKTIGFYDFVAMNKNDEYEVQDIFFEGREKKVKYIAKN